MPKINTQYDEKTKIKAVVLYNQVGSLRAVADTLGVRYDTMRQWHITDWWKEVEDDLKAQKRTKLSGQMLKLKDKAIEIVEDRLVNGDFFYDQKTGELIRRPVGADTAANIMRTTLDKHLQMEEMALLEKKVATEEKITDRLKKLGEDFQRFAKAKELQALPSSEEGTDGEISNNAIHDERETGLPEGESLGSQERGPADQGPSGAEYGSGEGGSEARSQTSDEYGSGSQESPLEGGRELDGEPESHPGL
jgi:hypothetical protein